MRELQDVFKLSDNTHFVSKKLNLPLSQRPYFILKGPSGTIIATNQGQSMSSFMAWVWSMDNYLLLLVCAWPYSSYTWEPLNCDMISILMRKENWLPINMKTPRPKSKGQLFKVHKMESKQPNKGNTVVLG